MTKKIMNINIENINLDKKLKNRFYAESIFFYFYI